jgi:hypothetical protein
MTFAAEVTITEESDYLLTSGYGASQSAATASGGNGILRARENPFSDACLLLYQKLKSQKPHISSAIPTLPPCKVGTM